MKSVSEGSVTEEGEVRKVRDEFPLKAWPSLWFFRSRDFEGTKVVYFHTLL